MLNKNDPLISVVQEVMKRNQLERDAAKLVNEKFGVQDRKAMPHEKLGAWDAAYKQVLSEGLHPNQQKLDVHEPEKDKLTKHDFKMLRAKKKTMEEENAPKTDPYAEGQASSISTVATPKKEVTPADQSALKKKIMSIKEAKSNAYAIGMDVVKKSTGDEPPMEKKNVMKAHKIAKKIIAKKKMNEGFNNRHGLSVTASAEKQAVAVLNEAGSPVPAVVKKQQAAASNKRMTAKIKAREPREPTSFERFQAREKENPTRVIGSSPVAPGPGLAGNIARVGAQVLPRLYNYLRGGNAQPQPGQLAAGAARRPSNQQSVPMVRQTSPSTGSNLPSGPWGSIARRGGNSRASAVSRQQSAATRDTFQSKLAQARQTGQQGRVGTNISGATQAAARIVNRPITPNAAGANAARLARMQGNKGYTIPQVSGKIGSPSSAQAATNKAGPSFEKTGRGTAPSVPSVPSVPQKKIDVPAIKVSDTEVMNSPEYKKAVKSVGGEAGAKKIQVGQNVTGLGNFNKDDTITSRVRTQLAAKKNIGRES